MSSNIHGLFIILDDNNEVTSRDTHPLISGRAVLYLYNIFYARVFACGMTYISQTLVTVSPQNDIWSTCISLYRKYLCYHRVANNCGITVSPVFMISLRCSCQIMIFLFFVVAFVLHAVWYMCMHTWDLIVGLCWLRVVVQLHRTVRRRSHGLPVVPLERLPRPRCLR